MSNTEVQADCVELNNHGRVIQFRLWKNEHRLGRDPQWADLVIPDREWDVISGHHAVFRRIGNFYWLYDGNGETKSSTNGTFLNHTRITLQQGYELKQNTQLQIGQNPQTAILLTYRLAQAPGIIAVPSKFRLKLSDVQGEIVLGRESDQSYGSIALPAPTVSRRHASIVIEGNAHVIRDHSTNGTYINKQRISSPTTLKEGDMIQIGSFTLLYGNGILELFDRGDQIRLDAHQLVRTVQQSGRSRTILDRVSFAIEPGQMIALVGGSGAGKSTLMKALLGIEPLTSGAILINGDNLRRNFDLYRSEIGYVPQDDIIHENLTVEEVLTYACKLRLPPDTTISAEVERTLSQVKLSHVRQTLVQRLSGGQRKRVSIAVELLANPKLFFLDEPTSGLDPGLDKKMMQLLRELADQGRTIVLVTHATSNLEVCDRVAFMGSGGKLCYFGSPQDAMQFFQAPSPDFKHFADIYIKLDEGETEALRQQTVADWHHRFEQSQDYQQYVKNVLSAEQVKEKSSLQTDKPKQKIDLVRQGWILASRYWTLLLRDRVNLILLLLTAPAGVILITLALRDGSVLAKQGTLSVSQAPLALRVLFVFTCATLWVGLSGTAQAIVREASIYHRERLINLRLFPYVGSKFAVHTAIAIVQSILITIAILIGFRSPESALLPWVIGASVTTLLTLLASVSLGLMISALVKNAVQANSMLPLILIPQIIFSGILFELDGVAKVVSWLMLSRWSIGAYASLVDVNAMVPPPLNVPGYKPPFTPTSNYDPTWQNLALNWGMLLLHSFVCLTITVWQQKRKDVR